MLATKYVINIRTFRLVFILLYNILNLQEYINTCNKMHVSNERTCQNTFLADLFLFRHSLRHSSVGPIRAIFLITFFMVPYL